MASKAKVKQYLACWLQLGKRVVLRSGQTVLQPQSIICGDQYSKEFESCWQLTQSPMSGDCHLEGMDQTLGELSSDRWDIINCARCDMPVPVPSAGVTSPDCPCHNLTQWPNNELPQPRQPVNSDTYLANLRRRLSDQTPEA